MVTYHSQEDDRHSREHPRRKRGPERSTRASRVDIDLLQVSLMQRGKLRLIVFRPGTLNIDRVKVAIFAWLAYRGNWPLLAGIGLFFPAPEFTDGGLLVRLLNALILTGGGLLVSWFLARPTLAHAHGISAIAEGTSGYVRFSKNMDLLEEFYAELDALERAGLSPVAHENEWGRIYNRLAAVNAGREI